MELTPAQAAEVAQWVRDGAALADVQRRLESEFSLRATYMETRFLVDDLDLELAAPAKKPDADAVTVEPVAPVGKVSVEISRVTPPGAMIGGSVTFSDGVTATWQVDMYGRLAMNPSKAGYQPSEEDAVAFQEELQKAARKAGMM